MKLLQHGRDDKSVSERLTEDEIPLAFKIVIFIIKVTHFLRLSLP